MGGRVITSSLLRLLVDERGADDPISTATQRRKVRPLLPLLFLHGLGVCECVCSTFFCFFDCMRLGRGSFGVEAGCAGGVGPGRVLPLVTTLRSGREHKQYFEGVCMVLV